jgi:hypothetical protein
MCVSSIVLTICSNEVMIDLKKSKIGSSSDSENQKKIAPIFLSNGLSSTLIIPIELARKYAIDRPSHVTIEDTPGGILIKKLEVKS